MGVFQRGGVLFGVLCAFGAAVASATPKLRLETAAVGPVNTNLGSNGQQQIVNAYNAGDGNLSLTVSSSVPWLTAAVGTNHSCNLSPLCSPVNIGLATGTLARGLYTGVVTVNDPNAIDAPQTITVTVQVGSGVPDSLDLYVAPGSTASTSFAAASPLVTNVTSPPSGPTLSVVVTGGGSFTFNRSYPYQVKTSAPAGTPEADYRGSIGVSGSGLPADNKSVPVTIHVTSQPIAAASPQSIQFRIAQGAAKATQYVVVGNGGLGTLALTTVSFTGTPPPWLTATAQGNLITLVADPTGLSPGVFTATASVASNARNGAVTIPIELDVLTTGPPRTYYQAVLDNATFAVGAPVAPGGIVALFGEQLTTGGAVQATSLPLKTTLGGATVTVNGQPAPVYYVSAGQIDFLIPYGAAAGAATVRVARDGQQGNAVSVTIAPVAPSLLPLGIGNYGNIVLGDLVTRPIPTTPGIASRPAKAGVDSLVIYALGLGQTTPAASDGVAAPSAEPLARVVPTPKVVFGFAGILVGGGESVDPFFAGLAPGFVGLYQVNVTVPTTSPRGDAVPVSLQMSGVSSNYVNIAVQ